MTVDIKMLAIDLAKGSLQVCAIVSDGRFFIIELFRAPDWQHFSPSNQPVSLRWRRARSDHPTGSVAHFVSGIHRWILLAKRVHPAMRFKDRSDQVVFSLALIRCLENREPIKDQSKRSAELFYLSIAEIVPLRNALNGFGQKVRCKQTALACDLTA